MSRDFIASGEVHLQDEEGNWAPIREVMMKEMPSKGERGFYPGKDMIQDMSSMEFTFETDKLSPTMWLLFTDTCRIEDRDYWVNENTPDEHPQVAD